jgi:hypothetical protein
MLQPSRHPFLGLGHARVSRISFTSVRRCRFPTRLTNCASANGVKVGSATKLTVVSQRIGELANYRVVDFATTAYRPARFENMTEPGVILTPPMSLPRLMEIVALKLDATGSFCPQTTQWPAARRTSKHCRV